MQHVPAITTREQQNSVYLFWETHAVFLTHLTYSRFAHFIFITNKWMEESTSVIWQKHFFFLPELMLYVYLCVVCQILEALARNDEQLVQTCSRLSSSSELIPEDLQTRFSAMCGERLEHINRRITNYRKVSTNCVKHFFLKWVLLVMLASGETCTPTSKTQLCWCFKQAGSYSVHENLF